MKHVEIIRCTLCACDDLMKNGHSPNGTQRWFCKGCKKYFQRVFTNKGRLPEIKTKVVEMTTNGSGIRDTSRVLGISPHTVISEIKKNAIRNQSLPVGQSRNRFT
jgi:transposase-like protein